MGHEGGRGRVVAATLPFERCELTVDRCVSGVVVADEGLEEPRDVPQQAGSSAVPDQLDRVLEERPCFVGASEHREQQSSL